MASLRKPLLELFFLRAYVHIIDEFNLCSPNLKTRIAVVKRKPKFMLMFTVVCGSCISLIVFQLVIGTKVSRLTEK